MIRLAAILLTLILAALPAGAQAPFDPFDRAGIDPKPGASVPLDLAFRDQTGARVTLGELGGGRPILLAPVLHDCPNICGVTMAGLARAIQAQDYTAGRDFAVVAFGIDPHEGPETARASLDELTQGFPDLGHGAMAAVTGQAAQIRTVTDALGFRYAWDESIGQYAHVAAVAVLTADGRHSRGRTLLSSHRRLNHTLPWHGNHTFLPISSSQPHGGTSVCVPRSHSTVRE